MVCGSEEEFQIGDIPDMTGYVAIVTGGNAGIGYETTLQLAKRGARVYIASRSKDRVDQAIAAMSKDEKGLDISFLKLDLQDLQSIKCTVEEFLSKETRLDILINNAGVSHRR
ncbi:short-chain dehydrogenase/reductase ARMGADRAFT_1018437 [Trichoderma asperellum]|uniref:Short-chain dehydrogenase/reductase ARMGADRAFT_1018437 n=1 Tax=Trichoderma asperellum TaxID=101201 RepID=A0A6V8QUE2_TRIAP|nr:short-chain dehydrogenase/reductase ARMGADRAFT_1018437 [Trichoderma asperellum]